MDYSTMLPWTLIVLACIHVILLARNRVSSNGKLPPGPIPLPIVGNLLKLSSKPNESFAQLAKTYGPLMTLKLGSRTTIVVSSSIMAKEVLQKNDQSFAGRTIPAAFDGIESYKSSSIISSPPTNHWRKLRTICNTQMFTTARLTANQGLRRNKVQDLVSYMHSLAGQPVNIGQATFTATLNLDLFIAGSETSSTAVEWAMAELLRNPDTMVKARLELMKTIGSGQQVEESDIGHLPYLQAIVKETMRLHPPAPLIFRETTTNVEICGFAIPKNTCVLVNAWAIGRDPDIWANPSSFLPERFLGSDIDFKGQDFELIPFGSGRRICPGLPLAFKMVHLMLASLLHSFNWKLPNGMMPSDMDMSSKFGITMQLAAPLRAIPTLDG